MTDLKSLFEDANRLNGELFREAEEADVLAMDLASIRSTLSGCVELARDYADENPGLTRELDRMRDELEALAKTAARLRDLARRLDEQEDAADTLVAVLDEAQYEQEDTADLAEMVRDVERGIRDPSELRYAIERIEPNYVL